MSRKPNEIQNAVAVIGMAGRFPEASTPEELWEILAEGRETIRTLTDEELAASEVDWESVRDDPSYVKARGTLPDTDLFDARFFGLTPRDASILDPQQRVWLEIAWEALESAGCAPDKYPGAIGVFAGSYINSYLLHNLCRDRDYIDRLVRYRSADSFITLISNDKDYLPSRTAFLFDLKGPAVCVQTACSTSLVAVAKACQSLLTFESDVCLAGGISITFPQEKGYLYQEGGMVSPDGHCRAFDAAARGTVFSNGAGVVVLKRLEDAVADRDRIRAVILGSAVNNDGSDKVSYTAPSIAGQSEVIAMAHAVADIDPETIGYVEAHGTGTPIGDPIEIAGLTRAFREKTQATGFCGIGSVKSNLGHLDAAAGVTGMIKTILALEQRTLPRTLHFETPNPEIDFDSSPFYVVDSSRPWDPRGGVRRAGVSSFGVGGTNAHVVLEEAPEAPGVDGGRDAQLLVWSARTDESLDRATRNLARYLKAETDVALADVAYTLQAGRKDFERRRFLVCRDRADAIAGLESLDPKRLVTSTVTIDSPSVVFLFPGQGSQHVDMARDLYAEEPVFRREVDRLTEVLAPELGCDLRQVIWPPAGAEADAAERLEQTALTQPALFTVELALARLWAEWGIEPSAMIGHSVGEFVAATLAGVFAPEDAARLMAVRARLMQAQPGGAMLAVRLPENEVAEFLGNGVSLAAVNAPGLSVVSGPHEAVADLDGRLRERKVAVVALQTSHAFHSDMMQPVLGPFTEAVAAVPRNAPRIPFVSSLTGTWITDDQATDPAYWAEQLHKPVRFTKGMRELDRPGQVLVEVGPGKTLSTLARQQDGPVSQSTVVASLGHAKERRGDLECVLSALGRLWAAGVPVSWERGPAGAGRRKVSLPTYAFERKRFWVDPPGRTGERISREEVPPVMERQAPPPPPTPDRRALILERLRALLYDLSGIEVGDDDRGTTFLEMGLDSLFLTQTSAEIQTQFGVKIGFRRLLEDVTTVDELVAFLDENLPAEAFAAPAPVAAAAAPAAPAAAGPVPQPIGDGSVLDRIIDKQLQLMAKQLRILRGEAEPDGLAPVASVVAPAPTAAPAQSPAGPRIQATLPDGAPRRPTGDGKRFGPYKALERARDGGLTDEQQRHLDDLVARFERRAPESKRRSEAERKHLADPREVSGFRAVWKELVFQLRVERSSGARIWDVDGNEYLDFTMCFGANLLGHAPSFVSQAIREQLDRGFEIGPQSPLAGELAALMCELTGMERVSFCNTGSEAVMAALRVARTVTSRERIAFFTGDYHGIFDEVLARAQVAKDRLLTFPAAPGILQSAVDNAMVLDYDSPESLRILERHAGELAAVLVEPVQSRHPEIRPEAFLRDLRRITRESGSVLVFDEVITGFRTHPGGIQKRWGIEADLAAYGKIIGGGLPIGALAGRSPYMDALDGGPWRFGDDSQPEADLTFFAGTFVRHPLALAAGRATLEHLREAGPQLQESLELRATRLAEAINPFFEERGVPIRVVHFSSWFRFDYPQDLTYVQLLFFHLMNRGIFIRDAGQNCFLSTAHTDEDLDLLVQAVKESVLELQQAGFLPGGGR